jgi:hypothetical protein
MPDYNLGKAHGTIRIDYDKSGAKEAREDIQDVGDEATRSSDKIDKSTRESSENLGELAQAARRASESLTLDHSSYDSMTAAVKNLEETVARTSGTAEAARARLTVAERNLEEVRRRGNASARELASAEKQVQQAQRATVDSVNRLNTSTRALSAARERLSRIPRMPDPTPDVDNNVLQQFIKNLQSIQTSSAKSAGFLNTFSGRLKFMIAGVAIAIPHIAGLGVALASLSGLAGVAAGALAGLAATGGTLAVGMSGIGEAFKSASQASKAAATGASGAAKAQRAAARSIENAKRSLADAEQNLLRVQEDAARSALEASRQVTNAQRDLIASQRAAIRAQLDLNKARQQATRDLEDMRDALIGGSLDERQAVLDLAEAQAELQRVQRDPTANSSDIAKAILNYDKAAFALDQVRKGNERLAVDQKAAAAAGVEGSSQVVSAQDAVRDSAEGVRSAQQGLADAQENVRRVQVESSRAIADASQAISDAQRNLADAYADAADSGTAASAKLDDAMKNLSPNARAFVTEVLGLKDAWQDVKNSVQDELFAGLAAEVKPLAQTYFPLLREGMGGIARGLNGMIKETVAYLKTTEAQANVKNIFDNTGQAMANLRGVVRDLVAAFLDIASVGSDFLPDMATGAANAAARFREFISAAKESGKLREWMQSAMDTASTLWQLIKNLADIIGTVFSAFDQEGGGALNTLTELTGKVAEFLHSAEGQEALHALGRILKSIGSAYGKVFLSFLETAADVLVRLEPFIVAFADAVGIYLAGALQVIGPVLNVFADVIGFLGPALGPVIAGVYAANKAVEAAKIVWAGLNVVMKANPFLQIAVIIIALVVLIIQNWDTISAKLGAIWEGIKTKAAEAWKIIHDNIIQPIINFRKWVQETWDAIGEWIRSKWEWIKNKAREIWNNTGKMIGDAIQGAKDRVGKIVSGIVDFFMKLPGRILDFLKSLPGKLANWAGDLISGIVRGLKNAASEVWNTLQEIISDAWDNVMDFFGISSPSKLAAEAGENIALGLAGGMDAMASAAVSAAAGMAAAVGDELTGASGTMAANLALTGDTSGLPSSVGMTAALTGAGAALAESTNGPAASGGNTTTIQIERLELKVAGNLDPTNPTAYRQTIKKIKDDLRNLDMEYA